MTLAAAFRLSPALVVFALSIAPTAQAQVPPGEGPVLKTPRMTQAMINSGAVSAAALRNHGRVMFASPFNKHDGYGDGPMNRPGDPTTPGGRPTLQNNGTFLRVNGLDAQTCVECHSVLSTAEIPFTFQIGGVGGSNNNVVFMPTTIDVSDAQGNLFAFTNGRYINPPFLFGAGGVELVAKEMTEELQTLKAQAQQNPGVPVPLLTKGVSFGVITYSSGAFDTSGVEGIDDDLVVRPFGRKGEFATTRAFDVGALEFHFGMQPVESVGSGVDDDGDGVIDEVLPGELSALAVFTTTMPRPRVVGGNSPSARAGRTLFLQIGCATCHTPELQTDGTLLTYSFPEVETDPSANIYFATDLSKSPTSFATNPRGGIRVPMFSDLKRHDMGPGLAESHGSTLDSFFVTARLWGIRDTAPYLHDGRALTLTDAILAHGGEAQQARNSFAALAPIQRVDLLTFLRTLRTPHPAAQDVQDG